MQLEVAQNKLQKRDREMEKLNKEYHPFRVDKDKELSAWHEEPALHATLTVLYLKLVAELDKKPSYCWDSQPFVAIFRT